MVDVAVLKCENYDEKVISVVKEALDNIGANKLLKKGMKVLIKPNLLQPAKPEKCISTHPKVIEGIIVYLKKHDVEIFIGESSGALGHENTDLAFKMSGIEEIAKKHHVEWINFEKDQTVVKKIKDYVQTDSITISKKLDEMDLIVNACKLKTHMLTGYTGAIKNTYGLLIGEAKIKGHSSSGNLNNFCNLIIDVFLSKKPQINIMDAIIGMEGNGPNGGTPKPTGLIIASKDGFALDKVASEIIGFKENSLEILKIAKNRNLIPEDINITGEKNVQIKYKKPITFGIPLLNTVANMGISFIQPRYNVDKHKCQKCGKCSKVCPKKVISFKAKEFPVFHQKGCILCACCHEVCPYDAIVFKKSILSKLRK